MYISLGDPNVYQLLWSSYNSTDPVMKWNVLEQSSSNSSTTTNNNTMISYNYSNIIHASTTTISKSSLCSEGIEEITIIVTFALLF